LSSYAECPGATSAGAIVVTGMTDPRGTEEYNLVLGERRAQVVKAYLERLGLAHDHVHARSVGEEFATGQDESAWSQERAASLEAR
jgi:peptidoglycan-associated lipoprotein